MPPAPTGFWIKDVQLIVNMRNRFRLIFLTIVAAGGLFLATRPAGAAPCDFSVHTEPFVCERPPLEPFSTPRVRPDSILTGGVYGWVEDYAYFYDAPEPGSRHVRTAGTGVFYGPVEEEATDVEGKQWYKVWDHWLPSRYFHIVEASSFAGVEVNIQPRRPFGWVLRAFEPRAEPAGEPEGAPELQRYDLVQIYRNAMGADGSVWYDVGGGRWVRYDALALLTVRERPGGVEEEAYWVDVDLSQQTFAAYEGDRMVFAGLISSGLPRWPTRVGLNQVWSRHETTPMSGGVVGDDYYYIEDVPHTLYFDGETALHGAYWHDDFGRPKSHGCVNMPPRAAEWVFEWSTEAPNDLWVWVHHSYHSEFTR